MLEGVAIFFRFLEIWLILWMEQKIYKMKLQSVVVSHIKKIQNKTEKLFMQVKESRKSPT